MEFIDQPSFKEPERSIFKDSPLIVHRHVSTNGLSESKSLMILVHGLGGRRYGRLSTWSTTPKLIFDTISTIDIGLYDYVSSFRRVGSSTSTDLKHEASILADIIRDASCYDNFVLLGHSMGGLLILSVLQYLKMTNQVESIQRIKGLFLFATPGLGSTKVPAVLTPFSKDLRVLKNHSQFVESLFDNIKNNFHFGDLFPQKQVAIPAWAVVASSDKWVDNVSSSIYFTDDRIKHVRGTHGSIVKMKHKDDDMFKFLQNKTEYCLTNKIDNSLVICDSLPEIIPKFNRALIEIPDNFINRLHLLESLREFLSNTTQSVVMLAGQEGIGKTEIMNILYNECHNNIKWSRRFRIYLWITSIPKKPEETFDRFVEFEIFNTILKHFKRDEVCVLSLDKQVSVVLEIILNENVLIFIDNVHNAFCNTEVLCLSELFEDFLNKVPSNSAVILSTAIRPTEHPNTEVFDVLPLLEQESIQLIRSFDNINSCISNLSNENLIKLARYTGGVPQLIQWAVTQISSGDNINFIKNDIRNDDKPSVVLMSHWNKMRSEERSILALLAYSRDPLEPSSIAEILDIKTDRLNAYLRSLLNIYIVYEFDTMEEKRYIITDLTKRIVINKYESENNENIVLHKMFKWMCFKIDTNADWASSRISYNKLSNISNNLLMVLEDYSGNYIAIEQRIKIAEKALNLLHYQGKWTEFYFLITQFIKEIDDKPCLNLLIMLGRHYAHQRNKQLALTTLYRAYNIAIESNDTAKAAECKMRIGHALTLVGEFASAREELQIATDLANEVNDKNTIISATGYLSDIDIQQGNYTKAIETLMSFRYEWDRASGYYNCMIGDAYNAKGDIEQALLYYKEAERLSLEWQDKRLQAWAYAGFAECGQGSNYAEEAKTVFNLCRMEREYDRIMHFQIANDYKVSHPQKIFIIGAPAAGKSTAAEVLNEIMISFKVKPSIISIHDIHVMLQKCPGNENLYSLAEDKSLVINDRNVAIEKAFQKLQAHCAEQSSIGGFVAEFASSSLDIELYRFEDLLNGALVLLIVAPEAIRTARNLQRPGKRVPSEIVKGYADCLDDMTIHVLSNCGAKIIKVSSDCPYELFKTRITNSYKLYYNAEYFSKQEIY